MLKMKHSTRSRTQYSFTCPPCFTGEIYFFILNAQKNKPHTRDESNFDQNPCCITAGVTTYRRHSRLCGSELAVADRRTATLDGSSTIGCEGLGEIGRRHRQGHPSGRVDVASSTIFLVCTSSLVAHKHASRDCQDVRAISTDGTASNGRQVGRERGVRDRDFISV